MSKLSGSYFTLLTPGNPKTVKGEKVGYMTFILHFSPSNLSGFNVCPMATRGCIASCLNTAGRGGIAKGGMLTDQSIREGRSNAIQAKRAWRTARFFTARETFMCELVADIQKAVRYCARNGFTPVFRLNGTSDIRWETVPCVAGGKPFRNIMTAFPAITFYDYTKIANRKNLPSNYHLTFSLADGNDESAAHALANGVNVAVVFRDAATVARYVETGFMGAAVHIGDDSDLRFLDERGICALYAKGAAKRDTSGFVRD